MILIPMQIKGSHQFAMAFHFGIFFQEEQAVPGLVHGLVHEQSNSEM
jgi:hypothetical protein